MFHENKSKNKKKVYIFKVEVYRSSHENLDLHEIEDPLCMSFIHINLDFYIYFKIKLSSNK